MGKYRYTETEQQINNVLKHQDDRLKDIHFPDTKDVDKTITESEELLRSLGYTPQKTEVSVPSRKPIMLIPSWAELCKEAERACKTHTELEELFTADELIENTLAIRQLNQEYDMVHRLDNIDITISVVAGLLSATMDILLVGIPRKTPDGLKSGKLADYIREHFEKKYPREEMDQLALKEESKTPYDAQDNRHTQIHVEGLSSYYHRLLSLGHDPLLGFMVGVLDIMKGTMTTIDKKGKLVVQVVEGYDSRKETNLFAAIAKQFLHLKSDVNTSMGLPAPLMALFNLFQFGKIGDEKQTIAEIVQGMYYEGYDFIHFCSMSIPVMVSEVIIRIGYAIKRIKEGNAIKDSIPVSLNREKHPKLATMLFIGHSAATAVNAGKVLFTKNPMAINYPQWVAFAKYSYSQLKWALIEKPELRRQYVDGVVIEELYNVVDNVNQTFCEFSDRYTIIMDAEPSYYGC